MTFNAPLTSYTAPVTKPTNGLATAALVLGIIAAAGALIPFLNIGSMIIAVIGAILGAVALGRARTVQVGVVRAWFGIILALATIPVALVVTAATADVLGETVPGSTPSAGVEQPETTPEPEAEEPAGTMAQQQATRHAEQYLTTLPFSKAGLITQLTNFDGYDPADAKYGVNHIEVDWNEQAALKAQDYLDTMAFSRDGLITQLVDFDGFTPEQAEYAVGQVGL
jgi:hypothetical protein